MLGKNIFFKYLIIGIACHFSIALVWAKTDVTFSSTSFEANPEREDLVFIYKRGSSPFCMEDTGRGELMYKEYIYPGDYKTFDFSNNVKDPFCIQLHGSQNKPRPTFGPFEVQAMSTSCNFTVYNVRDNVVTGDSTLIVPDNCFSSDYAPIGFLTSLKPYGEPDNKYNLIAVYVREKGSSVDCQNHRGSLIYERALINELKTHVGIKKGDQFCVEAEKPPGIGGIKTYKAGPFLSKDGCTVYIKQNEDNTMSISAESCE